MRPRKKKSGPMKILRVRTPSGFPLTANALCAFAIAPHLRALGEHVSPVVFGVAIVAGLLFARGDGFCGGIVIATDVVANADDLVVALGRTDED